MWKDGTLLTDYIRITVTNQHVHYKDEWIISVRELGWQKSLGISPDSTLQQAQDKAVEIVEEHLKNMLTSITNTKKS